ncbi:MAG: hypothetical protein JXB32_00470 [Deltaproteobacteria bacterium]|nr:hypothetical protein [Deltaproteobacteria bacterium]
MSQKPDRARSRVRRTKVEELERKVALAAPTQKKVPTPTPYAPGTYYGLVRRENVRRGGERA